jgi:hypothetical protein
MRIPNEVYRRDTWVIEGIAHDYELLDVWALPARGTKDQLRAFIDRITTFDPTTSGPRATRALFKVREILGRIFRWDDPDKTRRIPGSTETSLAGRVPFTLRATADDLRIGDTIRQAGARPLYMTEDECAIEIVNDTVHGVLHFGLAANGDGLYRPQMAIYVKPHGLLGRLYVKAIGPLRKVLVYPALMRQLEQIWETQDLPESP